MWWPFWKQKTPESEVVINEQKARYSNLPLFSEAFKCEYCGCAIVKKTLCVGFYPCEELLIAVAEDIYGKNGRNLLASFCRRCGAYTFRKPLYKKEQ